MRAHRWHEAEEELKARVCRRGTEDGFTSRRRAAISKLRTAWLSAE